MCIKSVLEKRLYYDARSEKHQITSQLVESFKAKGISRFDVIHPTTSEGKRKVTQKTTC